MGKKKSILFISKKKGFNYEIGLGKMQLVLSLYRPEKNVGVLYLFVLCLRF